jgi:Sulfotransferase family
MGEITPVFVCGMGRSGTTNALRILNTHPSVMLNGEISLSVLKSFFNLLDAADRSYGIKEHLLDEWKTRKAEYVFESFGYLSKSGRGRYDNSSGAHFRGHKSPRLETIFERYENHLGGCGPAPRYFFCMRNPFDCWRSYKTMTWSGYAKVGEFLEDYLLSFECLDEMQKKVHERIAPINLDDLKRAPDALDYYNRTIFAPLGLDIPERSAKRIAKVMGDRKPSSTPELSARDRKVITKRPGIADLLERYFPHSTSELL